MLRFAQSKKILPSIDEKKTMPRIRSPLRYPGGKTRAIKMINPLIPSYREFREPFVGGGSVFIDSLQENPSARYWINELN